jgi:hypothetical protein
MSMKNQKNVMAVGGLVVVLAVGMLVLGGFAKNEPMAAETSGNIGACPAVGCAGCPAATADSPSCAKACEDCDAKSPCAGCCGEPCPADCPKPCCEKKRAAGCCADAETGAHCSGQTDATTQ